MGHRPTRLDRWTCSDVLVLFRHLLLFTLLSDCYRTGDPVSGKRNYTYMDAVQSILGGFRFKICGLIQFLNLFGITVGYTIAASISMMAIKRSNCFHESGGKNPCHMSSNPYMICLILLSQIKDFDQIWWLSIVAAIMSFTYSAIGLALGIIQVAANGVFKGSLTGISIGTVTQTQKIWRTFQALGDIAFAYSYSVVLIEIQDTISTSRIKNDEASDKNKHSRHDDVLHAMWCMGYAAFGDAAPGNLLTGFGFYNPFWLLDVANVAIPIFAFVDKQAAARFPDSDLVSKELKSGSLELGHRIKSRFQSSVPVMFRGFDHRDIDAYAVFNDVVGILGALGFWPLTVYFPVEMYIKQRKVERWSMKWVCLKMLSGGCLVISVVAGVGSVAGVMLDLKVYKPFKTTY
ncbi:LOW QUALITY PROTEIN: hypothetical protein HID58_091939 [Brassica napus]|uniref:Amino acid transporter transmembrane domain-containing protein n=1 Tax=Brassica napus TaxID=3708 RepID=A0ABQ7X0B0_BRANA|nr:LOW QUALITY PROTEIN: hypothetical protein HID58_091939 [Brassica napus]